MTSKNDLVKLVMFAGALLVGGYILSSLLPLLVPVVVLYVGYKMAPRFGLDVWRKKDDGDPK